MKKTICIEFPNNFFPPEKFDGSTGKCSNCHFYFETDSCEGCSIYPKEDKCPIREFFE